jgi:pyruvate formate lyase activating enzyme
VLSGIIFDIQGYSIYDGPGIRTTIYFKGCPLRCAWCQNPESQEAAPQPGHLVSKCLVCGDCIRACPEHALDISAGQIVRERSKCIACGKCAEACPSGAMEMIGREYTASEVLEKVLPDLPFFENSGGGVTFSGGEATLQSEFLLECLMLMKENGIHTAIETAGVFSADLIERLAESTDLFLYDLKILDEDLHKKYVGTGLVRILGNFKSILDLVGSERILPRLPLIPPINTGPEEIAAIVDFLKESGYRGQVHLMPYNAMAKSKWEKIGRGDEYRLFQEVSPEELARITSAFEKGGFEAFTNH